MIRAVATQQDHTPTLQMQIERGKDNPTGTRTREDLDGPVTTRTTMAEAIWKITREGDTHQCQGTMKTMSNTSSTIVLKEESIYTIKE